MDAKQVMLVCSCLFGGIGVALAQPFGSGGARAYQTRTEMWVSGTGAGAVEGEIGSARVSAGLAGASGSINFRSSDRLVWGGGPVWQGLWLESSERAPLPESAHALALRLSGQWVPAERWSVRADVRPGVYSDWEDLSGQDFNAPALLAGSYQIRSNLVVLVGVNINLWSRLATIGGPGIWWKFADDWTLNLILPKPTLEYALARPLRLFVGGEIRGGAYRVSEDFGRDHGRPGLDGDKFSYRELRAGGGVEYRLGPSWRLTLEGGYAFDREFEFREADWEFRANGAPYCQFGVRVGL